MDRETGDFKGFGHIEFADTASTDLAVAMAGEMVLGRAIRVDYAKGKNKSARMLLILVQQILLNE